MVEFKNNERIFEAERSENPKDTVYGRFRVIIKNMSVADNKTSRRLLLYIHASA